MDGDGVGRGVDSPPADPSPKPRTWSTVREAAQVLRVRAHLRRTIGVALVVGTVLFAINQLDVVLDGKASVATYVKGALTYLVPFCVANYGILVATHRRRSR
jgi:hypothetical protein